MTIGAFLPVYNEEERIESCLKSLRWCDEIIVLDKESTDRTREIAARYTDKILTQKHLDYYSSSEITVLLENCTTDWVLFFTASDVMHPFIAQRIKFLISDPKFEYDSIQVPFHRYVLGDGSKISPWYSEYAECVAKKSCMSVNDGHVHDALKINSSRVYTMPKDNEKCIYHLTHSTVDMMMERHTRYLRGEVRDASHINLKHTKWEILKIIINMFIRKRTALKGDRGMALSFAHLSYYLLMYVYQWERLYGDTACYDSIREQINKEWDSPEYRSIIK